MLDKKLLKVTFVSLTMLGLSACSTTAWHRRGDYRQQAKTVPPIKTPSGTKITALQDYYPVPAKTANVAANETKPSLVPPGSNLGRFNKKAKASAKSTTQLASTATSKISISKWAQTKDGDSVLVLAENSRQARTRLGKALQATPYQVLDEDRSSGSFYLLDTKSTGNRITEKTPIYRLYVTVADTKTSSQVELLDKKNKPVKNSVAKRILGSLQKHLV